MIFLKGIYSNLDPGVTYLIYLNPCQSTEELLLKAPDSAIEILRLPDLYSARISHKFLRL